MDLTKHFLDLTLTLGFLFCFFLVYFCGCQVIDRRHNVKVLILTHAQFLFTEITIKQETN